jgi:3-hydroxyisobutyrate dehydrogenase-like beta-hydroxyacid dehydrogenase
LAFGHGPRENGPMRRPVSFIGFGEAAQAFATAVGWQGDARAYDRLTDDPITRSGKESDYARAGVKGVPNVHVAVESADLVLSLVTADQSPVAARRAAACLGPRALYCDMNSVAPATKREAAAAVAARGGAYVDVAIMSPVNPAGLAAALLLSGAEAPAAARELAWLGFSNLRVVGPHVGQASAIKMIRSVIVKGIEALTAEAMLAADAAGVAEEVLESLDASEKARPWAKRADYNLERMIVHGLRRADEMEEVAKTLEDLGVEPLMTRATARRQREIGGLRLREPAAGLAGKIDRIRRREAGAA